MPRSRSSRQAGVGKVISLYAGDVAELGAGVVDELVFAQVEHAGSAGLGVTGAGVAVPAAVVRAVVGQMGLQPPSAAAADDEAGELIPPSSGSATAVVCWARRKSDDPHPRLWAFIHRIPGK